jgi:hypothetical protein
MMEGKFSPSSQISGRMYNNVFSIKVLCEKCFVVLGLSQDGACTNLFENLSENSLKGDLSNDTTFNPPLFSLFNTFASIEIISKGYVLLEPSLQRAARNMECSHCSL